MYKQSVTPVCVNMCAREVVCIGTCVHEHVYGLVHECEYVQEHINMYLRLCIVHMCVANMAL